MKKEELVERLLQLGVKEEEIDKLKYQEMRALLRKLEEGSEDEEPVQDAGGEDEEAGGREESRDSEGEGKSGDESAQKVEGKLLYFKEMQLKIYESVCLPVVSGTKRVVVENIGMGDAFVDSISVKYDPKYKLSPGERKEFINVSRLFLGSASRPMLRISMFDK